MAHTVRLSAVDVVGRASAGTTFRAVFSTGQTLTNVKSVIVPTGGTVALTATGLRTWPVTQGVIELNGALTPTTNNPYAFFESTGPPARRKHTLTVTMATLRDAWPTLSNDHNWQPIASADPRKTRHRH